MNDPPDQVPEGVAVFPEIPEELGVHPLLLAVLHAVVFFDQSSENIVNDAAATEALEYLAAILQRLRGSELERVRQDMDCLIALANQEKWPAAEVDFLKNFMTDFGIGARPSS